MELSHEATNVKLKWHDDFDLKSWFTSSSMRSSSMRSQSSPI
jgi:hypothetical protein